MVEGARLESVYTATYRGFESLSLRHPHSKLGSGLLYSRQMRCVPHLSSISDPMFMMPGSSETVLEHIL